MRKNPKPQSSGKRSAEDVQASLNHELLQSVAQQLMSGKTVEVGGQTIKVERTGSRRFRTVQFQMDGKRYQAIEQNASKPSVWGKLARKGHQVVQFRDIASNKYVAVAVDGEVKEYGRM